MVAVDVVSWAISSMPKIIKLLFLPIFSVLIPKVGVVENEILESEDGSTYLPVSGELAATLRLLAVKSVPLIATLKVS